jgi:flagellar export protein FliJ
MKKFKFQLETVLSERKRVEDLKAREFTLAQSLLIKMIEELKAMEIRLQKAFEEATEASLDMAIVNSVEAFIKGTKLRIEWKKREIERAFKLVERKRLEYVFASQKRAALDKLKENKHGEFKEVLRKNELKALDDIYIMNGAARTRARNDEDEDEASA